MFAATLLAAGAIVGLAGATHGSDVRVSVGSPVTPFAQNKHCLLYTSPSPRDRQKSRMPSSA